jgi:hypothetical protein
MGATILLPFVKLILFALADFEASQTSMDEQTVRQLRRKLEKMGRASELVREVETLLKETEIITG